MTISENYVQRQWYTNNLDDTDLMSYLIDQSIHKSVTFHGQGCFPKITHYTRASFMILIGCSFCKWLGEITSTFNKNVFNTHNIPSKHEVATLHTWLVTLQEYGFKPSREIDRTIYKHNGINTISVVCLNFFCQYLIGYNIFEARRLVKLKQQEEENTL